MTNDEKDIRGLIDARVAALRAKDPGAMVAAYAERVVVFDLAPPLRQPDDARDPGPVERWLATFTGAMDAEVRDLEVTVGGDVAFCTSLNRLTATPAGTDEQFDLWHRVTLGLRKVDGRWQITHLHESVPFEMDGSMRASLDLTP
jgi:ketosteroid isomerase-like protein